MKIENFWQRTKEAPNGCLEWTGAKNNGGYGIITLHGGTPRQTSLSAHRHIYQLINGVKLARHQFVCHTCDNPSCVKPSHLFVGSPKDNTADMLSKGRRAKSHQYHHRTRKVTPEQVKGIREASGSLQQIADQFGVSISYVSRLRLLKNKRPLDTDSTETEQRRRNTIPFETVQLIKQETGYLKDIAAKYSVSISYVGKIKTGKLKRANPPTRYSSALLNRIICGITD